MEQPDQHAPSPGQGPCGTERDLLVERARELRRAGLSTRQIAERLGIPHNGSLARWLTGVAPPPWTARPSAKDGLRERARELRREGRTYDEIAAALSVSKSSCSLWLRDLPRPVPSPSLPVEPPPPAELQRLSAVLRRAGVGRAALRRAFVGLPGQLSELAAGDRELRLAPDEEQRAARWLRSRGWSLEEIARGLGRSSSAVSVWCRGVGPQIVGRASSSTGATATRAATRARRELRRQNDKLAAAQLMGEPDTRDLVVAAVTAYWCEGNKDKPYDRRERVVFVNSDPRLIRLWLRFLDLLEVGEERRRYRLQIHESADVAAAMSYWADVAGIEPGQLARPTLKHHRPLTNRRNVGSDYHGCFSITVQRSAGLYRVIEGAFHALATLPVLGSDTA